MGSGAMAFLVENVVVVLVFAIGLRTTAADLRKTWVERRLIFRALLVLELVVPVLAIAVVWTLPLSRLAAVIIGLMAACPGAPIALHPLGGRSTAVVILATVSFLAPLTVPLWIEVLERVFPIELAVQPGTLATIILVKLILPLLAGMAMAACWPRTARKLERVVRAVFWVGLVVALGLVLRLGVPVLLEVSPWAILAVLVVVLVSAAVAHLAGGPRLDDSRTLASIAVLGNPALALAVVAYSYPNVEIVEAMACYLIVRALALFPYLYVVHHWCQDTAASR